MTPLPPLLGLHARRLAWAASAVGQILALPLVLANDDEATVPTPPTDLAPMFVTGSMIPQFETLVASPVEVVDAARIEKAGATDVLDLLRRTTPVFLGNGNTGQEMNLAGRGEAFVAVRNLPTVVLLNGRRLANSGFSYGSAVDVNTIPVSAIERVEVFKDGASSIYGADAIGGVVNLITKKNFQGVEVKGRYGMTTRNDSWSEIGASAVAGIGDAKGSITAGAAYYSSDALLSQDRAIASMGPDQLQAIGLRAPSYISPTFPGRIDYLTDPYGFDTQSYVLAGSEFAKGAPGYNPAITTIPPAYRGKRLTMPELVAAGVYVPLSQTTLGQQSDASGSYGYPLLNTTLLGTHSIQSQDRRQAFATFEHELLGKHVELFGDFLFSDLQSKRMLAAAPAAQPSRYSITIPADNPYNPFGIDLGTGGGANPTVATRFMDLGNRISRFETSYYHVVAGLRGEADVGADWIERLEWHGAFNYNLSDQTKENQNSATAAALNLALQPDFTASPDGSLSRLRDARGPVPTYDYFALPGHNSSRTLDAIRATLRSDASSELYSFDAGLSFRAGQLPAGKIGWATGAEYRRETLELASDEATANGQGIGYISEGNFAGGARSSRSVFVESSIPLFSSDWAIPGFHALEISPSGRFEELDPGGSAAVPRVGLKWKPFDEQLTLRGAYSEGFLAPHIYELYGPSGESFSKVVANFGGRPVGLDEPFIERSSADIPASSSTSWTGGFAYSPAAVKGLLLTFDYYRVEQPIYYSYDWQGYVDSLNRLGTQSPFYDLYRDYTGNRITGPNQVTHDTWGTAYIDRTPGAQRTDGFDIAAQYRFDTGTAGEVTVYASVNLVLNYEFATGGIYYPYNGMYTEGIVGSQGAIPDYTLVTGLDWDYKDVTFGVSARYVPPMDDPGLLHPVFQGAPADYDPVTFDPVTGHGQTIDRKAWSIDDWYSIDMQVSYEVGRTHSTRAWYDGFKATIGVQNVTDNDPPIVASSGEDYTDKATYSILGRLVYFEVSKKF